MDAVVKLFLILHIAGGSLAVLSGYAALFAPKGGGLHRRAGMLFVYAMIALGAGALVVGLARGKSTWLGGPIGVEQEGACQCRLEQPVTELADGPQFKQSPELW